MPNLGVTAPGAYAGYVTVPHGQLVALPDGLPVEMGAHAEPLAVALTAVTLARVGSGDAALVYGAGTIGLNVIMCLRLAGVDLIVAAGRSPGRRAAAAAATAATAAAAAGADTGIDTREIGVSEHARRNTRMARALTAQIDPDDPDRVFEETAARIPPGRHGTADEVASLVVWLLSAEAS